MNNKSTIFLYPDLHWQKEKWLFYNFQAVLFFYPLSMALIKILTGKVISSHIKHSPEFAYAKHFKESKFRGFFFPMTIKGYHKKYANKTNPIYKKIYDNRYITPKTKVKTLAGNLRRQLSIFTTLSYTNNIIFDLAGVDPQGGKNIFDFIKTIVSAGGAAILIDHTNEFQNECTIFVKAQYLGD